MHFEAEFYDFIQNHRDDDPDALCLKYAGKAMPFPLQDAVTQIIARKKAATKIPGLLEKGLLFPSGLLAEQCSSQFMADLHCSLIKRGSRVADLTFGLGVDAFSIAGKAQSVYAVDQDARTVEYGLLNATTLNIENITVAQSSAEEWASVSHPETDTIFIDPARRKPSSNRAYRLEDCSPDLYELVKLPGFLNKQIIVKCSPMLDIDYVMNTLPNVSQIIIAAVKGECKELLIVFHTQLPSDSKTITAIDIAGTATSVISVSEAERRLPPQRFISSPQQIQPGMYLFEPNAALMKTAPWHHLEQQYPTLNKLSVQAHLFLSHVPVKDFPGRCWLISDVYHSLRQAARELKNEKANITTRGYPLAPQELRNKIHAQPCPDQSRFLIGTSAARKNLLILADTV